MCPRSQGDWSDMFFLSLLKQHKQEGRKTDHTVESGQTAKSRALVKIVVAETCYTTNTDTLTQLVEIPVHGKPSRRDSKLQSFKLRSMKWDGELQTFETNEIDLQSIELRRDGSRSC